MFPIIMIFAFVNACYFILMTGGNPKGLDKSFWVIFTVGIIIINCLIGGFLLYSSHWDREFKSKEEECFAAGGNTYENGECLIITREVIVLDD